MSKTLTIEHGPFKGETVTLSDLRIRHDYDAQQQVRTTGFWPHNQRMARLFERYPPDQGWGVEIDVLSSDLTITTTRTQNGMPVVTGPHPTLRFQGRFCRQGITHAQASTLAPLDVTKAYETGENNCLSRLLDHLGLPAVFNLSPEQLKEATPESDCDQVAAVITVAQVAPTSNSTASSSAASVANASEPVADAPAASTAASTPAAPVASEGVNKNLRLRLLNLHRKMCRGQAFDEPVDNAAAEARLQHLQQLEADTKLARESA